VISKCSDKEHIRKPIKNKPHLTYCATCTLDKNRAQLITEPRRCEQCGQEMTPAERGFGIRGGSHRKICDECGGHIDKFRQTIRKYGVDKVMWEAMYFEQDGQCALASCDREAVALDHDHDTGRPRGLLCLCCNRGLGFLEDEAWLKAAKEFLEVC
jgi:hypothetical protein